MSVSPFVKKSHVLHRNFHNAPHTIVSGHGITLTLSNSSTLLDASAGPSVSSLGHHCPEVTEAVVAQLNKIAYVYTGSGYTAEPCEELADLLLEGNPGGLTKCFFAGSGSEATDAMLKLATQYWHEKGQPGRNKIIARKQSYHGNTLGALSVSGHKSRRELYSAWISPNVSFVDPCYAYRGKYRGESDAQYVARLAKQLDDEFQRLGPENVAAFIAEPISGTSLGCVPAVPGYFQAMRQVCNKYGSLILLDEIMCGMGKTGTLHAWEQEGISPDLQTIGKALGGGFIPLSAVLVGQKVYSALAAGTGLLQHGHTFQAHPTACAAAVAVQKIMRRDNILQNVQEMGKILQAELRQHIGPIPCVGDIRGRGLFWAVEFVQDRVTKQSFPVKDAFCARVVNTALELGLSILGNLGTTGEWNVEHVIIAPPFIVKKEEIQAIVQILKEAITLVADEHAAGQRVYREIGQNVQAVL